MATKRKRKTDGVENNFPVNLRGMSSILYTDVALRIFVGEDEGVLFTDIQIDMEAQFLPISYPSYTLH